MLSGADGQWALASPRVWEPLVLRGPELAALRNIRGAMKPGGRWFLMTGPKKGAIEVIDLQTMQVARKIATQADPEEVIVTPDDKEAWMSSPATGSVAEIDLAQWELVHKVETGRNSDGIAWAK